jgi:hypothetical protein
MITVSRIFVGALIDTKTATHRLVGVITAKDLQCSGDGDYPIKFDRVTSQLQWILQNSDAGQCQDVSGVPGSNE